MKWDYLPDGRPSLKTEAGNYRVSTVYLGGFGIPFDGDMGLDCFETMVFMDETGGQDYDCERHRTIEDAQEGHLRMVEKWKHL